MAWLNSKSRRHEPRMAVAMFCAPVLDDRLVRFLRGTGLELLEIARRLGLSLGRRDADGRLVGCAVVSRPRGAGASNSRAGSIAKWVVAGTSPAKHACPTLRQSRVFCARVVRPRCIRQSQPRGGGGLRRTSSGRAIALSYSGAGVVSAVTMRKSPSPTRSERLQRVRMADGPENAG